MTFETIETRSAGIANFDYFSADIHGETVSLNGTDYPLGQITLDLMNLTNDFRTELLIRCLHVFEDSQKLLGGECSEALLKSIREHIFSVLDYISDVPPFSYFDTADSRRVAEETCSDARISEYVRLNRDGPESVTDYRDTAKMWNILYGLLQVYTYLGSDTANFTMLAGTFTGWITDLDSRSKSELADTALKFFSDQEMLAVLHAANPCPYLEGITFRPRATVVPAIPVDRTAGAPVLVRRVYYGRLMDFLIGDLMEGLAVGHYLYRCKVCGRFFLMTSAHRQYYCQTVNPEYGVPCANVAKNRKVCPPEAKERKQKAADSPIAILYRKRSNSIRKDKSRGKITGRKSENAMRYLKSCYSRARAEPSYAESQYEADIQMEHIYENAD